MCFTKTLPPPVKAWSLESSSPDRLPTLAAEIQAAYGYSPIIKVTKNVIFLRDWIITRCNAIKVHVSSLLTRETPLRLLHDKHMSEYMKHIPTCEVQPQAGAAASAIIKILSAWEGFQNTKHSNIAHAAVLLLSVISSSVALSRSDSIPEKLLHVTSLVSSLALFITHALKIFVNKKFTLTDKISEDLPVIDTITTFFDTILSKIEVFATDSVDSIFKKFNQLADKGAKWFTMDSSRFHLLEDAPRPLEKTYFNTDIEMPEFELMAVESTSTTPPAPVVKSFADVLAAAQPELVKRIEESTARIDTQYTEILRLEETPTPHAILLNSRYDTLFTKGAVTTLAATQWETLADDFQMYALKLETQLANELKVIQDGIDQLAKEMEVPSVEQKPEVSVAQGIQGFAFVIINIIVVTLFKKGTRISDMTGFLSLFRNVRSFIKETKEITKDIIEAVFQIENQTEKYVVGMYEALISLGNALNRADVRVYSSNPTMFYHLRNFEKQIIHVNKLAFECKLERRVTSFQSMLTVVNKTVREKYDHISRASNTTTCRTPTRLFQWWSPPGLGKSTIVSKLYNDVGKHFGWPTASYNVTLDNAKFFKEYNGQKFGLADEFMRTPYDPLFDSLHEMASPNFQNLAGALPEAKNQPNALRACFLLSNKPTADLASFMSQESAKAMWSRIETYRFRKDIVENHLVQNPNDRYNIKHLHQPDGSDVVLERTIIRDGSPFKISYTLEQFTAHVISELEKTERDHQTDSTVQALQDEITACFDRYHTLVQTNSNAFTQQPQSEYAPQSVLHIYGKTGCGKTRVVTELVLPRLKVSFPKHACVTVASVQQMRDLTAIPSRPATIYFVDDPLDYDVYMDLYNTAHRHSVFVVCSNLEPKAKIRSGPVLLSAMRNKFHYYTKLPPAIAQIGLARRLAFSGAVQVGKAKIVDIPSSLNKLYELREGGMYTDATGNCTDERGFIREMNRWTHEVLQSNNIIQVDSVPLSRILGQSDYDIDVNVENFAELAQDLTNSVSLLRAISAGRLTVSQNVLCAFSGIPDLSGIIQSVRSIDQQNFQDIITRLSSLLWSYDTTLTGRIVIATPSFAASCANRTLSITTPVRDGEVTVNVRNQTVTLQTTRQAVPFVEVVRILTDPTYSTNCAPEIRINSAEILRHPEFNDSAQQQMRTNYMNQMAPTIAQTTIKVSAFLTKHKSVIKLASIVGLVSLIGSIVIANLPSKKTKTVPFKAETCVQYMNDQEYKEYLRRLRFQKTRADVDSSWRTHARLPEQMLKNYQHTPLASSMAMQTPRLAYNNLVRCHHDAGQLYGIMLVGNVGITNAHLFPDSSVGTQFHIYSENLGVLKKYPARVVRLDRARDHAFFCVADKFADVRDIRSHFLPSQDLPRTQTAALLKPDTGTYHLLNCGVTFHTRAMLTWKSVLNPLNTNIFLTHGITTDSLCTTEGDCGLPYIGTRVNNFKIIGIHSAGNASTTTIASITQDDFAWLQGETLEIGPQLQSEVSHEDKLRGTVGLTIGDDHFRLLQEEHEFITEDCDFDAPPAMDLTSVGIIATSKRVYASPLKPNRFATPYSESLQVPNDAKPASEDLRGVDTTGWPHSTSPSGKVTPCQVAVQIEQFAIQPKTLDSKILESAVKGVSGFYKRIYGTKLRLLNDFETLNGTNASHKLYPGCLTRIDPSASSGLILHAKFKADHKGDLFDLEVDGTLAWKKDTRAKRIQQRLQIMEDCLHAGERVFTIYKDIKKTELLSSAKIAAGNVRLFQVCGTEEFLLCRKYFGAFTAATHLHRESLHARIGDDQTTCFHNLATRLLKTASQGEDGDFKKFDKTIPAELVSAAIQCINATYGDGKNAVRTTLGDMLTRSIHLCYSTLYQKYQGNPSGNFITTILNCVVNDVMAYYLYEKILGTPLDEKLTDWISNGDDVTTVISPKIADKYNFQTRQAVIKSDFGMNYTLANKTQGDDTKVLPLKEMSFVSRRFTLHGQTWTGALKTVTLDKLLHWTSNSLDYDHLATLCDTVLAEAGAHEETTGQLYIDQVRIACKNSMPIGHKLKLPLEWKFLHQRSLNLHNDAEAAPVETFMNIIDSVTRTFVPLAILSQDIPTDSILDINCDKMNCISMSYEICQRNRLPPPVTKVIYGKEPLDPHTVNVSAAGFSASAAAPTVKEAKEQAFNALYAKLVMTSNMTEAQIVPPSKGRAQLVFQSGNPHRASVSVTIDSDVTYYQAYSSSNANVVKEAAIHAYNKAALEAMQPIYVASTNNNEYDILSNFGQRSFFYEGKQYPTVEHAYQIMKDPSKYQKWITMTPSQVKRAAKGLPRLAQAETTLFSLNMRSFYNNKAAMQLLLSTGSAPIVHNVKDAFWGYPGENKCGITLMQCRSCLNNRIEARPQVLLNPLEAEQGGLPLMQVSGTFSSGSTPLRQVYAASYSGDLARAGVATTLMDVVYDRWLPYGTPVAYITGMDTVFTNVLTVNSVVSNYPMPCKAWMALHKNWVGGIDIRFKLWSQSNLGGAFRIYAHKGVPASNLDETVHYWYEDISFNGSGEACYHFPYNTRADAYSLYSPTAEMYPYRISIMVLSQLKSALPSETAVPTAQINIDMKLGDDFAVGDLDWTVLGSIVPAAALGALEYNPWIEIQGKTLAEAFNTKNLRLFLDGIRARTLMPTDAMILGEEDQWSSNPNHVMFSGIATSDFAQASASIFDDPDAIDEWNYVNDAFSEIMRINPTKLYCHFPTVAWPPHNHKNGVPTLPDIATASAFHYGHPADTSSNLYTVVYNGTYGFNQQRGTFTHTGFMCKWTYSNGSYRSFWTIDRTPQDDTTINGAQFNILMKRSYRLFNIQIESAHCTATAIATEVPIPFTLPPGQFNLSIAPDTPFTASSIINGSVQTMHPRLAKMCANTHTPVQFQLKNSEGVVAYVRASDKGMTISTTNATNHMVYPDPIDSCFITNVQNSAEATVPLSNVSRWVNLVADPPAVTLQPIQLSPPTHITTVEVQPQIGSDETEDCVSILTDYDYDFAAVRAVSELEEGHYQSILKLREMYRANPEAMSFTDYEEDRPICSCCGIVTRFTVVLNGEKYADVSMTAQTSGLLTWSSRVFYRIQVVKTPVVPTTLFEDWRLHEVVQPQAAVAAGLGAVAASQMGLNFGENHRLNQRAKFAKERMRLKAAYQARMFGYQAKGSEVAYQPSVDGTYEAPPQAKARTTFKGAPITGDSKDGDYVKGEPVRSSLQQDAAYTIPQKRFRTRGGGIGSGPERPVTLKSAAPVKENVINMLLDPVTGNNTVFSPKGNKEFVKGDILPGSGARDPAFEKERVEKIAASFDANQGGNAQHARSLNRPRIGLPPVRTSAPKNVEYAYEGTEAALDELSMDEIRDRLTAMTSEINTYNHENNYVAISQAEGTRRGRTASDVGEVLPQETRGRSDSTPTAMHTF